MKWPKQLYRVLEMNRILNYSEASPRGLGVVDVGALESPIVTNCSIIVNTSLNVRGEPIVCGPEDAFRCFMGTELDFSVIGNCVLINKQQDHNLIEGYKEKYELD